MTMTRLPISLEQEPLVDALFEVRFKSHYPLSVTLPGILIRELELETQPEQLAVGNIPAPVRSQDPALRYSPVLRLRWDDYFVAIGDQCISVSCDLRKPYPKWPNFKAAILRIVDCMAKAKISSEVERYSVKYVNLIPEQKLADQISKINMTLSLGGQDIRDNHINVQVHVKEGDFLHIVSVVTGASGRPGRGSHTTGNINGIVVDIDSIKLLGSRSFSSLVDDLDADLEALRQSNKKKFFDCLTEKTIKDMGPSYE